MKSITRFTKNIHGNKCLNCEIPISEENNFCPNCGQVNDEHRLSVKQYFSEYLAGFYSFDNRFVKTVIPLIFKPGKVTREYVSGKRIRYVNPFQLYLHITILFFLMIGIFNAYDKFKPETIIKSESDPLDLINAEDAIMQFDTISNSAIKEVQKKNPGMDSVELAQLQKELNETGALFKTALDSPDSTDTRMSRIIHFTDSLLISSDMLVQLGLDNLNESEKDSVFEIFFKPIDKKIKGLVNLDSLKMNPANFSSGVSWNLEFNDRKYYKKAVEQIEAHLDQIGVEYQIPYRFRNPKVLKAQKGGIGNWFSKMEIFYEYHKENPDTEILDALDDIGYERSYQNVFSYSKAQDIREAWEDPEARKSYLDRIISKISVALFFLLPVFTLMVSLLYIRSRYNYTEHLVFVFHIQTAFFLLLMLFMLIDRIFKTSSVEYVFIILFLIYLYKAMRNFYKQNRFKTIIKYLILNFTFQTLAFIGGLIISFIAFLL